MCVGVLKNGAVSCHDRFLSFGRVSKKRSINRLFPTCSLFRRKYMTESDCDQRVRALLSHDREKVQKEKERKRKGDRVRESEREREQAKYFVTYG